MSEKTLFNYYSLDECIDKKLVMNELKSLKADGKIEYSIDHGDILKLVDIDLEEMDIDNLSELFDENDIFPYLDHEDEDDSEDDYSDDWDNNDDGY